MDHSVHLGFFNGITNSIIQKHVKYLKYVGNFNIRLLKKIILTSIHELKIDARNSLNTHTCIVIVLRTRLKICPTTTGLMANDEW